MHVYRHNQGGGAHNALLSCTGYKCGIVSNRRVMQVRIEVLTRPSQPSRLSTYVHEDTLTPLPGCIVQSTRICFRTDTPAYYSSTDWYHGQANIAIAIQAVDCNCC